MSTYTAHLLSVSSFGALGDGTHDDTAAIQAALDAAAPLGSGQLKRRRVVQLPVGVYRLTAPLRLGAFPIAVSGEGFVAGCGDSEPAPAVVLLADHGGPVIEIGSAEAVVAPDVALHGLSLVRAGSGGGDGVHVLVASRPTPTAGGLELDGLVITGMGGDGIHLDLGEVNTTPVRVRSCAMRQNHGWGLWCTGALAQGTVRDSAFEANAEGGVRAGSFGLELLHNRFVHQARPVVVEGRSNRGVTITQNSFTDVGAGRGCVDLRHVHRFRVENNVFGGPGAHIPPVFAERCADGRTDVATLLVDCADVISTGGYLARSAFAGRPAWSAACWSLSRFPAPLLGLSPVGVPELIRHTLVAPPPGVGLKKARLGALRVHVVPDDLRTPGRFTLEFEPQSDLEDSDLAWIALAVRYTVDLPPEDARLHLALWAESEETALAEWAFTPPTLNFVGETLLLVVGLQRTRAEELRAPSLLKPHTHPRLGLRLWAFGAEHQGVGAHVTRAVMVRFPDGGLPGRPDLHPESRAYPPPMPLLDPFPVLLEMVEHPRLTEGLD